MVFGSTILEVAIGLALIYTLFAVICSALNEWMTGVLKLRGKTLQDGIRKLLNDPDLAARFFEHPLYKGLKLGSNHAYPSYVPAQTFARILIDLLSPAGAQPRDLAELYKRAREYVAGLAAKDHDNELGKSLLILMDEAAANPEKLQSTLQALQKLEESRKELLEFVGGAGNEVAEIEFAATTLEKIGELEAALKRTQAEAAATINQVQVNVEHYFDEAMERLSGWYKRRVQLFILLFALGVSLLLNVDSLSIASRLANDPALRQTLVTEAEKTTEIPETGEAPAETITEVRTKIKELGIPIGWQSMPQSATDWVVKLFGLLISTVAIAQGAPFWFDLLGKLVNVRMTGKKPATASDKTNEPSEKSKEPPK